MRGISTDIHTIQEIKFLRTQGKSINEISGLVRKSKSIVSRHIQGVTIEPVYFDILKAKQGASKQRSQTAWSQKKKEANSLVQKIGSSDRLLLLAALYWAEGTKKELNIINSDPRLLRVVLYGLEEIGVPKEKIKATLRIYGDLDKYAAVEFWAKQLDLPPHAFKNINVLRGKKEGKLIYGMCRIRVEQGGMYFKLIQSLILRITTLLP